MSPNTARDALFPVTQRNVDQVSGYNFGPWAKETGFKDFFVTTGHCSVILPLSSKLKLVTGPMCGQAIMVGIYAATCLATGTSEREGKRCCTHFLSPAANDEHCPEAIVKSFRPSRAYVERDVVSVATGGPVAFGVSDFAFLVGQACGLLISRDWRSPSSS
jgi:hypothetical protein